MAKATLIFLLIISAAFLAEGMPNKNKDGKDTTPKTGFGGLKRGFLNKNDNGGAGGKSRPGKGTTGSNEASTSGTSHESYGSGSGSASHGSAGLNKQPSKGPKPSGTCPVKGTHTTYTEINLITYNCECRMVNGKAKKVTTLTWVCIRIKETRKSNPKTFPGKGKGPSH